MEYKLSKEVLDNDALYDTIKALHSNLSTIGQPLYIVGACARDIAMNVMGLDASTRRTQDLDVAVMLENWDDFDELVKRLEQNGFERHYKTQKFFYKGFSDFDYEVDIVPFGNIADNQVVKWPPDGNPELSVRCFTDVMKKAMKVIINEELPVNIAPVAGQFLIKLDAWNDRHLRTDKDASDMFIILDRYYDYILESQPERFAEIDSKVITDEYGVIEIAAYFIACDAADLLSVDNLKFYVDFLLNELDREESSDLVYHFTKFLSGEDQQKYDIARNIWVVIHKVLEKELNTRYNGTEN